MLIIGCDFHTRFQQIAMVDTTTGELVKRRLEHGTGEAERFYAALPAPARVGIEATIATQWFENMLTRYGHELWFGDAAEIRAAMVRKQKTDDRDALHILDLLMQNRFPRIWVPSAAERDVRQLVRHRHKLVRIRTSVMNQLHALAMGQGLCLRKKLWTTVGEAGRLLLPSPSPTTLAFDLFGRSRHFHHPPPSDSRVEESISRLNHGSHALHTFCPAQARRTLRMAPTKLISAITYRLLSVPRLPFRQAIFRCIQRLEYVTLRQNIPHLVATGAGVGPGPCVRLLSELLCGGNVVRRVASERFL
jgi:hypothetical protein